MKRGTPRWECAEEDQTEYITKLEHRYKTDTGFYNAVINSISEIPPTTRALFFAAALNFGLKRETRKFFRHQYQLIHADAVRRGVRRPPFPAYLFGSKYYDYISCQRSTQSFPRPLADAIAEDDPNTFNIYMTLYNLKITKTKAACLIDNGAARIIMSIQPAIERFLTLNDLILYCCSSVNLDTAAQILTAIEKNHPGSVRSAVDILGSNALWYILYNNHYNYARNYMGIDKAVETHPIVEKLLGFGCNPDQPNCLKLSFNDIKLAKEALARCHKSLCKIYEGNPHAI